jgi:hypothetical protein
MTLIIVSLDENTEVELSLGDLNYDADSGQFWMRCVMGDDWFQRVTSRLEFRPRYVRFVNGVAIVVFDQRVQSDAFCSWLDEALAAVEYGYRTMRG